MTSRTIFKLPPFSFRAVSVLGILILLLSLYSSVSLAEDPPSREFLLQSVEEYVGKMEGEIKNKSLVNNGLFSGASQRGPKESLVYLSKWAMTRQLAEESYVGQLVGFVLLNQIVISEHLNDSEKAKVAGAILGAMSRHMFAVIRHQQDKSSPDGRVHFGALAGQTMLEVVSDFFNLFYFPKAADGGRRWAPLEQNLRERLVADLIPAHKSAVVNLSQIIPQFEERMDGPLHEYIFGQYHYMVERILNVRMERDRAQQWTRLFYFFSGLVLFIQPPFAYTTAEYLTYWDAFNAGLINLGAFWTLYLLKGMTSSVKTTRSWADLYDQLLALEPDELTTMIRRKLTEWFPKQYFVPLIPATLRFEVTLRKRLYTLRAQMGVPVQPRMRGVRCQWVFY